ncbi:hypothetical protein DOY81_009087 [Sarcophaga bullata]|nr:hypothetical protein DOY81_009087 [Sarcophaga bullata]
MKIKEINEKLNKNYHHHHPSSLSLSFSNNCGYNTHNKTNIQYMYKIKSVRESERSARELIMKLNMQYGLNLI